MVMTHPLTEMALNWLNMPSLGRKEEENIYRILHILTLILIGAFDGNNTLPKDEEIAKEESGRG